jgi:PAS domain S-box-containing protein
MALKIPTAKTIESSSWFVRTLLGACVAAFSVGLTYAITPMREFPLLLAFPTVILSGWFLGMAGSFGCAVVDVTLIDIFLTQSQFRFSDGFADQVVRLSLFLVLSTLVGVLIRRWADQREQLNNQELRKSLILEQTQRQMAEERIRAGEKLRERDAALRIALRASGMGLWTWDLQRDSIHWTDEVYKIMGHAPQAFEANHEAWFGCIHPEDQQAVRDGVAQVLKQGKDFHRQYRIVAKDGAVRWVESQGQCQRDKDGKATWIMGVLMDITDRKQMAESMLQAEKLAVAGRLAASVAHEINNPLEAVSNLLFLITLTKTSEEAHTYARNALDELLRVSMITQSTLKFHRQPGSPKITMLSEVVEGVVQMYRARLNASDITVDVETSNEVAIACMPTEAQQIFANLIANSVDAMTQSGKLFIRLRPSHDWRDRCVEGMRVTFCDSGMGMSRKTMRRIFEPFFTTKSETGTGLGLWVVAQLVERHGGDVRVWSTQRKGSSGTVFSIFLPVAHPATVEGPEGDRGSVPALPLESPELHASVRQFSSTSSIARIA